MLIKLTPLQKKLLRHGIEKGFLLLDDFNMAYSSKMARHEAITRLESAGLMKQTPTPHKFDLNIEKIKSLLN